MFGVVASGRGCFRFGFSWVFAGAGVFLGDGFWAGVDFLELSVFGVGLWLCLCLLGVLGCLPVWVLSLVKLLGFALVWGWYNIVLRCWAILGGWFVVRRCGLCLVLSFLAICGFLPGFAGLVVVWFFGF